MTFLFKQLSGTMLSADRLEALMRKHQLVSALRPWTSPMPAAQNLKLHCRLAGGIIDLPLLNAHLLANPPMIPNYRIRFYCLIGVLICGLGMTACTEQTLNALFYQTMEVTTGRGVHRVQEYLTLAESPIRFCWYFCLSVLGTVASSYGAYKLGRGVLLGRAAYKQWQLPEWKN